MHGRNVDKEVVKSPLDGSAGHLQHDMHLLDGEHEQDGPKLVVVEQLATEVRIHGRKFEQVLEN